MRREGALHSAIRTSQLIGAVAMVLAAWNMYAIPAALLKHMREAFRQVRNTIGNSHLARSITASYASLTMITAGGEDECVSGSSNKAFRQ